MPPSTDALGFYDLNHPWGDKVPLWPCFPDAEIERFHYHAKSGVLSQPIANFIHCTIRTDAPARVIAGKPFMDEVPLDCSFGTAVWVSIPKGRWEVITAYDLEKAEPKIQAGDIVVVDTGWPKYYGDYRECFRCSPGRYEEVGLEDTILLRRKVLGTNVGLVKKTKRIASESEREIAARDEAREVLGLKGKDTANL